MISQFFEIDDMNIILDTVVGTGCFVNDSITYCNKDYEEPGWSIVKSYARFVTCWFYTGVATFSSSLRNF